MCGKGPPMNPQGKRMSMSVPCSNVCGKAMCVCGKCVVVYVGRHPKEVCASVCVKNVESTMNAYPHACVK